MRIADKSKVALKIIDTSFHPYEIEIAQFFSSEALASDKRNHCVPIQEVLKIPNEEKNVIMVMPVLRPWDAPPFRTVGEGVDFFSQIFEVSDLVYCVSDTFFWRLPSCCTQGLQFMHMHQVAHR